MTNELSTYSFTEDDINVITYALRRLSEITMFNDIKDHSLDLIQHIERMKNEKKG